MVAVILFVALLASIAVAVVIFVVMRRRNESYRKSIDSMTYGLVKSAEEDI